MALALLFLSTPSQSLDIMAMYRGSCQIDTGVVLRVDATSVIYLDLQGAIKVIPRYEIVGIAAYSLPSLYLPGITLPRNSKAIPYEFKTFRNGKLTTLVIGWPIEYNNEHIQVLTIKGQDYLVHRDAIWGVNPLPSLSTVQFKTRPQQVSYKLRHPLAFENCADNITPGQGTPVPVIPQTTLDNPISIKRYHDHLREGIAKVDDYTERQVFYAIPQYYVNRTRLGTWGMIGSRYTNIGSRQTNFLPLVENELSEGPFGFQRLVRSGVAPLLWAIQEEPIVQAYYGLKADYIHFEVFFDPTAPLIGSQYQYSKGQLNDIDDRLIETAGVEFGADYRFASIAFAYTEGQLALRGYDNFAKNSWSLGRVGLHLQYNHWRLGFYAGSTTIDLDEKTRNDLVYFKTYGSGRLGRLGIKAQYISRQLKDLSAASAALRYESKNDTLALETNWDLNYRWTLNTLGSLEFQNSQFSSTNDVSDGIAVIWPKLAAGVTIAF